MRNFLDDFVKKNGKREERVSSMMNKYFSTGTENNETRGCKPLSNDIRQSISDTWHEVVVIEEFT